MEKKIVNRLSSLAPEISVGGSREEYKCTICERKRPKKENVAIKREKQ